MFRLRQGVEVAVAQGRKETVHEKKDINARQCLSFHRYKSLYSRILNNDSRLAFALDNVSVSIKATYIQFSQKPSPEPTAQGQNPLEAFFF